MFLIVLLKWHILDSFLIHQMLSKVIIWQLHSLKPQQNLKRHLNHQNINVKFTQERNLTMNKKGNEKKKWDQWGEEFRAREINLLIYSKVSVN